MKLKLKRKKIEIIIKGFLKSVRGVCVCGGPRSRTLQTGHTQRPHISTKETWPSPPTRMVLYCVHNKTERNTRVRLPDIYTNTHITFYLIPRESIYIMHNDKIIMGSHSDSARCCVEIGTYKCVSIVTVPYAVL